ncbi:tetratricopeptide repeat protein [Lysobacter sp. Root916]|uniref:tetratricopeptide repeat protein n=1 Tax=Lysobacter sp. Root916 TaxID=1736606 RepID=UPI000A8A4B25|nr:tetratricopeptide repeat protein [Lysobacter sp. Root916]
MTAFVLASAALVLLVLAYVLRPLWRAKPVAAAGVFVGLAAITGLTYALIGTPDALNPARRDPPATAQDAIAQLEAQLEREPNRIDGWRLLARAYAEAGRLDKARAAIARALKLAPEDPDLLVESAEISALATDGRKFDPAAVASLRRALDIQPMHQRARWFLGISLRQSDQPAEAARTWEPLLAVVDPRTAASLREQIDAARKDAGQPPLPAPPAAASAGGLKIRVALAPALAAKLPADASLFVLARQPDGPPMPVAVEKLRAKDFPVEVVLDDGDSPMPTLKLSQLQQVAVLARVSASGQAIAQSGDLASKPQTVRTDSKSTLEITIDQVVP